MSKNIYNFCIIAHIDHGKSTLADRMLELTHTVEKRQMKEQMLDAMDLEREKGITIKLQPVRMEWQGQILNLIDTPGHVDFEYEVSRSLQAVEGAILLVDATQGVQAQTISNLYLALEQNLEIVPVINKIDLPAADVTRVEHEIIKLVGGEAKDILHISAKTGEGVEQVLNAIITRMNKASGPDGEGLEEATQMPLRALVFDSVYDDYKGVVAYVRVVSGRVSKRDSIIFLGTGASDKAVEVGVFLPDWSLRDDLKAGEIGYIATGLKDVRQARVGDTLTLSQTKDQVELLPGFSIPQPKVFAGVFPTQGDDLAKLREAMGELVLNDASLSVQPERNEALGQGFRCGFLGMLHMEIVQERLKREYELELVFTTPSVLYRVWLSDGREIEVATAADFPDPSFIERIQERYTRVDILTPLSSLGAVFELLQEREGVLLEQNYFDVDRAQLSYELPLRELVVDLYDQIKTVTSGYGSFSYELSDWREADVIKLSILVNHEIVEALSMVVARNKAGSLGRRVVSRLKDVLPRQLFSVPIQAAIGGTVIARETLPAMRKDVTGHLYGGDVTRKKKLLEKQKKGKKKLAGSGSVIIPPEAYLAVFKRK